MTNRTPEPRKRPTAGPGLGRRVVDAVRFNPLTSRKQFWIFVREGLCNRLRVLLSAIGFSEMTGRKLRVCWPVWGQDAQRPFEAALSDLWIHPYREVSIADWYTMHGHPGAVEASFPPDPGSTARVLYLETLLSFFEGLPEGPAGYLSRLRLVPALEDRVERFAAAHFDARPCFGVHVRSHKAHRQTSEHSPADWFERRMEELGRQYPAARFFLSCDSGEVSARFHRRFGDRVCELCTPPGYNTVDGIQKGVVDLYLLARTDYILGSHYSSFSEMASWMQGEKGFETALARVGALPGRHPDRSSRESV
jgi:hypothetical protein